jgi:hypothetical protein
MFDRVLPLTVFLLLPASAFAQTDSNITPAQLVDALNALFGKQTDNRAFAGVPAIPDTDPKASPRGLAVKFHLPEGTDTDLVTHSYVFDRARLAPAQTVLIHGAAGNVGAYAMQFARMVRARVIATASKGTSITSIASTPTRSSTSMPLRGWPRPCRCGHRLGRRRCAKVIAVRPQARRHSGLRGIKARCRRGQAPPRLRRVHLGRCDHRGS